MRHRHLFFVFCSFAAACATEVTSTPTPAPSSIPSANEPSPERDASANPGSTSKEAGTDAGSKPSGATILPITSASYFVTAVGETTSAIGVEISLENDGSDDVTSIDEMTFDFGGGDEVALNQPACAGNFSIPAGSTKTIQVTMVVSAGGSVSRAGFSMKCGSSQNFGAGDGTAPTDSSFASPIAITIGGKTEGGTFAASGVAARK
jgi:hypothetical protein